ncbi:NmrA family transcriptional regulator [Sphingomonas sp.]|uniref:NmrA family transcriptional regulator n=1 Tax=Sphingomonas sp. TaxID=28214 RepID=UPI0025CED47C|nr:NmrA family transcriptional regulator [Sphingomonas sp.]
MLEAMGFGATILRPTYFIDNEAMVKDVVLEHGVYPMPIGSKGVAMVSTRDIAEVAAIQLIRRDTAPTKLPIETINVIGPDTLTGDSAAAIWADVLDRPVVYGGGDPAGFEQNMATFLPRWTAYEMRLMAERYVSDGMIPETGDIERLTAMLGRPLHSYREFVAELVSN